MTLLWMDGFDLADRAYKYTAPGQGSATGRLGTGRAISCNSTGDLSSIPIAASNSVVVGVAMNLALNRGSITFLSDARATSHIAVMVYSDGSAQIRRGSTSGTVIASVPAGTLSPSTWHYIEAKVTAISDTIGSVEVRADGDTTPFMSFGPGDTKNAGTATTIDGILLGVNGTTAMQYDDLYILNTDGAAPNNNFLGDVKIVLIEPTGNGNYSQLTGSDGNSTDNYLLVEDAQTVATADYVGGVAALKDSYAMGDLSGVATVFAIQELAICQKSDAGAGSMKQLLRRSGTDYTTAAAALSTSWTQLRNIRATDPSTGNQWTVSGVNAIEAGVETA